MRNSHNMGNRSDDMEWAGTLHFWCRQVYRLVATTFVPYHFRYQSAFSVNVRLCCLGFLVYSNRLLFALPMCHPLSLDAVDKEGKISRHDSEWDQTWEEVRDQIS